jgi:hypothetical protein
MTGMKGSQRTIGSTPQGADDRAVATMIRLIHDLYASNGAGAVVRELRDDDLIKWSEVVGAVRGS